MQNLQSLELANNQLTTFYDDSDLSKDQINMASLTYLSLNGNNLTRIPPVLKYLPKLL